MSADILIVGQGLAGTLVAWELERAGFDFKIIDRGHVGAASWAGAGIVNPVTGQRFVPSWRIDELLPLARSTYMALEHALGISLWRDMRIRRVFTGDDERRRFATKHAAGELAPYVCAADADGFWIEQAGRVDVRGMLTASRERWRRQGRLEVADGGVVEISRRAALVVDCTGRAAANEGPFSALPWAFSKGEVIEIEAGALGDDVILARGHWVLPVAGSRAWVGATHEPLAVDPACTAKGREELEMSARAILQRPFATIGHRAGVRVNAPDRRPVAGRHPRDPRIGIVNGLGAKGVLWAPELARCWAAHLANGTAFPREVDVARLSGW